VFEEYDAELSDAATLDFIESLGIVRAHSEEIERHEIANAMLKADQAVINKHLAMFDEGLVKTPDGKYQYNPRQNKALKEHKNKLDKQLREKKISF
jgi:predicted transcriptional regulator